jgi:hypothetical protein
MRLFLLTFLILTTFIDKAVYHSGRHDSVTLSPLLLQRGLRFGTIQRNGAAPEVIHTGFFLSECHKWKTFTTIFTAIDPNKDISKTRQVHVK